MWRAPDRRPSSSKMKRDVILCVRIVSRAVEANSSARDRARVRAAAVAGRRPSCPRILLEKATQVAVGDDAEEAAVAVDDGRDAHHLAGHLVDGLGHRRVAAPRAGRVRRCA